MGQSLEMFYKDASERERYSHGILWRGIEFFTTLIAGLIVLGISVSSLSLQAGVAALVLGIILSFLGHYVLIKESWYFHEERWKRMKIQNELKYYGIKDFGKLAESDDSGLNLEEYLAKNVTRKSGVRYAFRLLYLLYSVVGWFVYLFLFAARTSALKLSQSSLLDLLGNSIFLTLLIVAILLWYRHEIRGLLCPAGR